MGKEDYPDGPHLVDEVLSDGPYDIILGRDIPGAGSPIYLGSTSGPDRDETRERRMPGEMTRREAHALATLWAASPDILDALKSMRIALAIVMRHAPGYDWNVDPMQLTRITGDVFAATDAAIAKAKGATP